ncbi:MAG: multicopper oxidase family protein [Saprospiraceae bacterium]
MKMIKMLCIILLGSFIFIKCHNSDELSNSLARKVIEQAFNNPIAIPPIIDATIASFEAKSNTINVDGKSINTLGYGGASILGPTLKIQQGAIFNLAFTNQLSEPTNIHWHGLVAPPLQDGYPTDVTNPGGTFNYKFKVNDRPGTYWYHPHPDMSTASQAYRGLAGFFIISSPEEKALNLPEGQYDIPLVVQDKGLTNGLTYNPNNDDRTIGLFGESILVNGTMGPFLDVATRTYRLRLLNGSNARIYNFSLSNGAKFNLIGTDGGLIDSPKEMSSVLLSPGERADILVNFGSIAMDSSVFLVSNTFSGAYAQGYQMFKLMKFTVKKVETDPFTMPSILMPVEKLTQSESIATRKFIIGHDGMGHSEMHHGGSGVVMHPLDGKFFDPLRRDEVVRAGTIEIWEFDNSIGTETHPMHLHGLQFQVLKRTGGRAMLEPWELGWKDTVLAFPGEKVSIIIRFPDNKGKFVFHCHNLEHEDAGMMLNFEIQ